MTVKAATERNFRRARAKPGRRRRFRPHVSWSALRRLGSIFLLVFGSYQAVSFALTTPLLRVNRIAVHGNVRLSSGQVQALVDDLRGTSILRADLDAFRERLMESPWVADAALRRVLPGTIEILVSERRPIGLCRLGQELYLTDETGTLIDHFGPQYAEFDLPIIDGLVPSRGAGHEGVDPKRAALAARVIASLSRNAELSRRLSLVDVSEPSDVVVLLENDAALLHLGRDHFLERLQAYTDLSTALRERVPEIDYVDLRFDRRVYVRPAAETRRSSKARPRRAPAARTF